MVTVPPTRRRSPSSASGCAKARAVVVRAQKVRVDPVACAVLQVPKELTVDSVVRRVAKAVLLKVVLPVLQAVLVVSVHKAALLAPPMPQAVLAAAHAVVRAEWSWA